MGCPVHPLTPAGRKNELDGFRKNSGEIDMFFVSIIVWIISAKKQIQAGILWRDESNEGPSRAKRKEKL